MRLLYLMHVNWFWIRQRPHVLAEKLSQNYEVQIMHFAMYHKPHKAAECPPHFPAKVIWRIPERILKIGLCFDYLNKRLLKYQINKQLKIFKPDIIWVTHPIFELAIRDSVDAYVIYDCMDDHLAFNSQSPMNLLVLEKFLLSRANITVFSSKTLSERVSNRSIIRNSITVNNGVSDTLLDLKPRSFSVNTRVGGFFFLGYFGTISHWFDWNLILILLDTFPNLHLRLAGPVETLIPQHSRIEYVGTLPHNMLIDFVQNCDALIMPFVVNSLIEAVDPVKLYEYIAFGLPSIAPRYQETMRFYPFVSLYDDVDEALKIVERIISAPSQYLQSHSRRFFLESNSWNVRYDQIEANIKQSLRNA